MVAKTEIKTKKQAYPDFYLASNNCVVAAYPVAADILRREEPVLAGVPFLFYVGTRSTVAQVNESAQRMAREAIPGGSAPHYFSASDLDTMLQGTITTKDVPSGTKYPEHVEIVSGRSMPLDKLASWWVPYSFGVGHEDNVRNHKPFRALHNYQIMVKDILPDVRAERAYMKEQEEKQTREAAQLGNRVKALLGLYHPTVEAYTPRIAVHRFWK